VLQVGFCVPCCPRVSPLWCHIISTIHSVVPPALSEPDKRLSRIRLLGLPCQRWATRKAPFPSVVPGQCSSRVTLCVVAMVLRTRTEDRGDLRSAVIGRFAARPVPIPCGGPSHVPPLTLARATRSRTRARARSHAWIAPQALNHSMLSETPGAGDGARRWRAAPMACAHANRIGWHPNFRYLGAVVQIQSIHSSPRDSRGVADHFLSGPTSRRLTRPYLGRLLVLHCYGTEPGRLAFGVLPLIHSVF